MSKGKLLVVEDDPQLREALCDTLELAGFTTRQVESAEAALALLTSVPHGSVDMVVSDVNMGEMDGYQLLERLRHQYAQLPVLLITAYGDIASAVAAMRNGAVDYLIKPFKPQVLVDAVSRYIANTASGQAFSAVGDKAGDAEDAEGAKKDQPVAVEASSQQLLQLAQRVAATDSTVLISGESGTGKEVLAQYIHNHSTRAQGPFIAINCAAIPENMLEATLFGYEKGAFTGAYNSSPGKFEQADGGTLLLDEISEMDLGLQAKLLRVLQEREVERLGGKKVIKLNVRVVATTNRELQHEVKAQRFREDLYYRLSVFPLQWLPLRQRKGDIVPLAQRLLSGHASKMQRSLPRLDASALSKLQTYGWPGNVRELDNVIQRALILQQGDTLSADDLRVDVSLATVPTDSENGAVTGQGLQSSPLSQVGDQPGAEPGSESATESATELGADMKHHEFQLIVDALRGERGRKKQAAEKLGISPRTLRYKMAKMRDSGFDLDAALSA